MKIVEYPHPYLRAKCHPLKKVDKSIKAMMTEMLDLMHAENGVGLAAPQVEMPFRLIVVSHDNRDYGFINPVIKRAKKSKLVEGREGCLSFTDLFLPIQRRDRIRFHAYTMTGDHVDEIVTGELARILQHEVDHLDGRLFIDKLGGRPDLQKRVVPYLEASKQAYFNNQPEIDTELIDNLVETYC